MDKADSIWTVVLAAGASSRFGSPKPRAGWKSGTLLSTVLAVAQAITPARVLLVTGAAQEQVTQSAAGQVSVYNQDWVEGMGSSLAAALKAVLAHDPEVARLALLLVDQPLVTVAYMRKLIAASEETGLCALSYDGENCGPPAILPRSCFLQLQTLSGDHGLKAQLRAEDIVKVYAAHEEMRDADTPDQLEALRALSQ